MSGTVVAYRWFVGIDLHKETLTACVYCSCCGEIRFQKLSCRYRRQVAEFFGSLPRPHVVAIEAVGFYRWLWEMLEPLVDKLLLADATQPRALAGRRIKTDREDARNVAELLACGRLPVACAPSSEVQVLRNAFARQRAQVLIRVKSVMNANNRPRPARMAVLCQYRGAIRSVANPLDLASRNKWCVAMNVLRRTFWAVTRRRTPRTKPFADFASATGETRPLSLVLLPFCMCPQRK
jgi:hypothetical protein